MARALDPGRFLAQLETSASLPALTVITGDETLLVNECADALRSAASRAGYDERVSLTLDARSDWSALAQAQQSLSLFGTRRLISLHIPSGRPGRTGGEALQALAGAAATAQADAPLVLVLLPRLDRATKSTRWAKALLGAATVVEVASISREQLPAWIRQRLARQGQQVDDEVLEWMADRVEGHLLAAFQEIQKLGLLYPQGRIESADVEQAVLNVARYNVFSLRDAMLAGQARRTLSMLAGLRAEGEALPLVLWAIGDEVRLLSRLAAARESGQLAEEMRRQRLFYAREAQLRKTLDRVAPHIWPAAVRHAHDIDRLIKGVPTPGRLTDPWHELARLALRVALPAAQAH